jgi:hypothetical protein
MLAIRQEQIRGNPCPLLAIALFSVTTKSVSPNCERRGVGRVAR